MFPVCIFVAVMQEQKDIPFEEVNGRKIFRQYSNQNGTFDDILYDRVF